MHSCRRDDGARFLGGLLTTKEESTFVDHLETCPYCREWLEKDSGSNQHWQWARELLSLTGDRIECAHAVGRASG